jgi:hypothetical protein
MTTNRATLMHDLKSGIEKSITYMEEMFTVAGNAHAYTIKHHHHQYQSKEEQQPQQPQQQEEEEERCCKGNCFIHPSVSFTSEPPTQTPSLALRYFSIECSILTGSQDEHTSMP